MYKHVQYDLSLCCPAAPAACYMMGVWSWSREQQLFSRSASILRRKTYVVLTGQAVQGSNHNEPIIKSYKQLQLLRCKMYVVL